MWSLSNWQIWVSARSWAAQDGGSLVATGATTGYDSTIDLRFLFFKGTNLLGSTQALKQSLKMYILG